MSLDILIWGIAPIMFGLMASGVYTWLNPRRQGTWPRYATMAIIFTAAFYAATAIIYSLLS